MNASPPPSGSVSAPPRRGWAVGTVALLVLVAAAQLGFLSRHSLRNNEFITLRVLDLSYGEILRERPSRNHMPGYFLALKAWTDVFGQSEAMLHLPSALVGLAGILLVWRLAVHLYGSRAGLLALALCGFNQIHAQMGADARMYSSVFFGAALATWAFLLYLDTGRARYVVGLAAAGVFTLGVQMLHAFVALPMVGYALARRRALRGRVAAPVAAALLPFLIWFPVMAYLARVEDKIGPRHPWRPFFAGQAVRQVAIIFHGDTEYSGRAEQGVGALLLTVCTVVVALPGRRWRRRGHYLGFLALLVLVPLVGIPLLGLRSTKQMVNSWRYYVTAAAAAPLLLTAGYLLLWRSGRRRWAVAYAAASVLVVLANLVAFLASPGTGVREIVRYIGARWQPGDVVATSRAEARSRAFPYYGALEHLPRQPGEELETPADLYAWLAEQCAGAKRLWLVFYSGDRKHSEMADAVRGHADAFAPVGKRHAVGETAVQLYEVHLPPRQD